MRRQGFEKATDPAAEVEPIAVLAQETTPGHPGAYLVGCGAQQVAAPQRVDRNARLGRNVDDPVERFGPVRNAEAPDSRIAQLVQRRPDGREGVRVLGPKRVEGPQPRCCALVGGAEG